MASIDSNLKLQNREWHPLSFKFEFGAIYLKPLFCAAVVFNRFLFLGCFVLSAKLSIKHGHNELRSGFYLDRLSNKH